MKITALTALFVLAICGCSKIKSSEEQGGKDTFSEMRGSAEGNGGGVVVCFDSSGKKTIELLDLFEARVDSSLSTTNHWNSSKKLKPSLLNITVGVIQKN